MNNKKTAKKDITELPEAIPCVPNRAHTEMKNGQKNATDCKGKASNKNNANQVK